MGSSDPGFGGRSGQGAGLLANFFTSSRFRAVTSQGSSESPGDGRGKADRPSRDRGGPSLGSYAGHGLQFAVSIVVFLYAGQWLDRRLGTGPWLMLILMFVGAGASFYSMYTKLMAAQEHEEAARKAERERGGR